MAKQVTEAELLANWVGNVGDSCTSAAVLTALGALGGKNLPGLADASALISAKGPYQPPDPGDYIGVSAGSVMLRRAPIDSRIEQLAASCGLKVRSTTRLAPVPSVALAPPQSSVTMPGPREVLIGHMAYGQEAPGQWGWWGVDPFSLSTWTSADTMRSFFRGEIGHTVVIAASNAGGWDVVDSNHTGIQRWPRPGWAMANTRIQLL